MRRVSAVLVFALAAGCAGTSQSRPGDRNVLTVRELGAVDQGNVYDLVQSERPWWLRVRGSKSLTEDTPIMVYVDGSQVGSVDVLRTMSPFQYREIRYYGAGQAQARFGPGNVSGAIELLTQR